MTFDGRTVMVNGGSPPRAASTLLLARYRGLSLSGGGDNVRHAWSSPGEPPLTVFLALDEATPFYKLAPAEDGTAASWTARLWTGRQLDSGALAVTYTRPWRDAAGFAHMEETHRVTVHQGVPVRAAPAQPCE